MTVRPNKKMMLAAAVVIMLNISSCKKYDDGPAFSLKTKTARLTGEWEVVEVENQAPNGKMTMEFDKDGDFTFEYSYDGSNYSSNGEWEWESGKESVELEIDNEKTEWEILRLTNKELWFEDEGGNEWQCEKE